MIICNLTRNLLRTDSCGYSLPSVVSIYLINYDDITSSAITVTEGTGTSEGCDEITAINLGDKKAYKIVPTKDSASFEDALVVADNGNKYRSVTLTFNVAGVYNACMKGSLDALSLGQYMAVVATADGNYIAYGHLSPLEAETATFAGGSDTNGVQIVLSGNIAESGIPLSADAVEDLLGFVPTA